MSKMGNETLKSQNGKATVSIMEHYSLKLEIGLWLEPSVQNQTPASKMGQPSLGLATSV